MDQSPVLTSEGCRRRFHGRSRRCCPGYTAPCHLQARTVTGLGCRWGLCLLSAAAAEAAVGDRSLVEKHGKIFLAVVGLDSRKMTTWVAAAAGRTWWSSPDVLAVGGVGEFVGGERERSDDEIGNRRYPSESHSRTSLSRFSLQVMYFLLIFFRR